MNKNDLLALSTFFNKEEFNENLTIEDLEYELNPDVSDCQTYMHFYMMLEESDAMSEEMFAEFFLRYEKLSNEQKQFVKNDYLKIKKAQDENIVRARKKGND